MRDKTLCSVDQFFQIFNPVGAVFIGTVVGHQAGFVQQQLNDFAQSHAGNLLTHHIQHGDKTTQIRPPLSGGSADGIVQRTTRRTGNVLQLLDGPGTNTARRKIHHPQKTRVIVGVFNQAQIRQGVLDFGTFKKPQSAIDTVGHSGIEQSGFHDPTLRVAAVQDGNFFAAVPIAFDELSHFIDQPLRLSKITCGFEHPDLLACTLGCAEIFAQTVFIVTDQCIG